MIKLFRKLLNALFSALASIAGSLARPPALILRLSLASTRLVIAQPRFWARVKSALTIPGMAYGAPYAQGGYAKTVNLLIGAVVAIFAVIIIFAYLLPQAYVSSGNMSTALTTAGAATQSIQWWTWLMWGAIVLVIVGVVLALIKGKGKF